MRRITVAALALFVIASCKKEIPEDVKTISPTVENDVTATSKVYVTDLFEYRPAPGQFINKNPGNEESARGILGQKGMVSLGAWGGYIVLGFDHNIINEEGKPEFIVYGNPMDNFSEPGIIWVMADYNKNKKPDDTWYEIKNHNLPPEEYERNYEVTYFRPENDDMNVAWRDNKGNNDYILRNEFHEQPYFPQWISGPSYTLRGSRLKGKVDKTNPTYVQAFPYKMRSFADDTVDGDTIDIDHAVDENGQRVNLKGIRFVKIQTGVMADMGWLGESSTEVIGVADMKLLNSQANSINQ